jgi:tryptophan synthase alpha chain
VRCRGASACRRCWTWSRLPARQQHDSGGADGLRQSDRALRRPPSQSGQGDAEDSAFIAAASRAGVDGLLVVDYPPEECEGFAARLKRAGLDLIFLLAPTSTEQRMKEVGRIASGYVYYVSLKGVTGAGHLDTAAVAAMLPRIRQHVAVPVGVGFGIRDAPRRARSPR